MASSADATVTADAAAPPAVDQTHDAPALPGKPLDTQSCLNDPNFAIICAFLQKFAGKLNIVHPNFQELQQMLENTDDLAEDLKLLIIKLLRKTRKNVPLDKWEHAVAKFCHGYSAQDAWEIERFGYKKSSLPVKLRVLKEILECQFERNVKFKADVNLVGAEELRTQPIGKDRFGNAYWSLTDAELNLRIYQEHLDEDIWKLVANDRNELRRLIECLKGGGDQRMLQHVAPGAAIGVADEDSSSNSMTAVPKVDALGAVDALGVAVLDEEEVVGEEEEEEEEDEDEEEEEDDDESDDEDDSNESDVDESSQLASDEELTNGKHKSKPDAKRPSLLASKPPSKKVPTPVKAVIAAAAPAGITAAQSQKSTPPINIVRKRPAPPPSSSSSSAESDSAASDSESTQENDVDVAAVPPPNKVAKLQRTPMLSNRITVSAPLNTARAPTKDTATTDGADDDGNESEDDDDDDDDDEPDDEDEEEEESDDDSDEVGDEIAEPVLHVRGSGSGRDNNSAYAEWPTTDDHDDGDVIGEAIEEDVLYVCGVGSGADCMVGNPPDKNAANNDGDDQPQAQRSLENNEATTPAATVQPMFFFGQAGCLNRSPMKAPAPTVAAPELVKKFSLFDDDNWGESSPKSVPKTPASAAPVHDNGDECVAASAVATSAAAAAAAVQTATHSVTTTTRANARDRGIDDDADSLDSLEDALPAELPHPLGHRIASDCSDSLDSSDFALTVRVTQIPVPADRPAAAQEDALESSISAVERADVANAGATTAVPDYYTYPELPSPFSDDGAHDVSMPPATAEPGVSVAAATDETDRSDGAGVCDADIVALVPVAETNCSAANIDAASESNEASELSETAAETGEAASTDEPVLIADNIEAELASVKQPEPAPTNETVPVVANEQPDPTPVETVDDNVEQEPEPDRKAPDDPVKVAAAIVNQPDTLDDCSIPEKSVPESVSSVCNIEQPDPEQSDGPHVDIVDQSTQSTDEPAPPTSTECPNVQDAEPEPEHVEPVPTVNDNIAPTDSTSGCQVAEESATLPEPMSTSTNALVPAVADIIEQPNLSTECATTREPESSESASTSAFQAADECVIVPEPVPAVGDHIEQSDTFEVSESAFTSGLQADADECAIVPEPVSPSADIIDQPDTSTECVLGHEPDRLIDVSSHCSRVESNEANEDEAEPELSTIAPDDRASESPECAIECQADATAEAIESNATEINAAGRSTLETESELVQVPIVPAAESILMSSDSSECEIVNETEIPPSPVETLDPSECAKNPETADPCDSESCPKPDESTASVESTQCDLVQANEPEAGSDCNDTDQIIQIATVQETETTHNQNQQGDDDVRMVSSDTDDSVGTSGSPALFDRTIEIQQLEITKIDAAAEICERTTSDEAAEHERTEIVTEISEQPASSSSTENIDAIPTNDVADVDCHSMTAPTEYANTSLASPTVNIDSGSSEHVTDIVHASLPEQYDDVVSEPSESSYPIVSSPPIEDCVSEPVSVAPDERYEDVVADQPDIADIIPGSSPTALSESSETAAVRLIQSEDVISEPSECAATDAPLRDHSENAECDIPAAEQQESTAETVCSSLTNQSDDIDVQSEDIVPETPADEHQQTTEQLEDVKSEQAFVQNESPVDITSSQSSDSSECLDSVLPESTVEIVNSRSKDTLESEITASQPTNIADVISRPPESAVANANETLAKQSQDLESEQVQVPSAEIDSNVCDEIKLIDTSQTQAKDDAAEHATNDVAPTGESLSESTSNETPTEHAEPIVDICPESKPILRHESPAEISTTALTMPTDTEHLESALDIADTNSASSPPPPPTETVPVTVTALDDNQALSIEELSSTTSQMCAQTAPSVPEVSQSSHVKSDASSLADDSSDSEMPDSRPTEDERSTTIEQKKATLITVPSIQIISASDNDSTSQPSVDSVSTASRPMFADDDTSSAEYNQRISITPIPQDIDSDDQKCERERIAEPIVTAEADHLNKTADVVAAAESIDADSDSLPNTPEEAEDVVESIDNHITPEEPTVPTDKNPSAAQSINILPAMSSPSQSVGEVRPDSKVEPSEADALTIDTDSESNGSSTSLPPSNEQLQSTADAIHADQSDVPSAIADDNSAANVSTGEPAEEPTAITQPYSAIDAPLANATTGTSVAALVDAPSTAKIDVLAKSAKIVQPCSAVVSDASGDEEVPTNAAISPKTLPVESSTLIETNVSDEKDTLDDHRVCAEQPAKNAQPIETYTVPAAESELERPHPAAEIVHTSQTIEIGSLDDENSPTEDTLPASSKFALQSTVGLTESPVVPVDVVVPAVSAENAKQSAPINVIPVDIPAPTEQQSAAAIDPPAYTRIEHLIATNSTSNVTPSPAAQDVPVSTHYPVAPAAAPQPPFSLNYPLPKVIHTPPPILNVPVVPYQQQSAAVSQEQPPYMLQPVHYAPSPPALSHHPTAPTALPEPSYASPYAPLDFSQFGRHPPIVAAPPSVHQQHSGLLDLSGGPQNTQHHSPITRHWLSEASTAQHHIQRDSATTEHVHQSPPKNAPAPAASAVDSGDAPQLESPKFTSILEPLSSSSMSAPASSGPPSPQLTDNSPDDEPEPVAAQQQQPSPRKHAASIAKPQPDDSDDHDESSDDGQTTSSESATAEQPQTMHAASTAAQSKRPKLGAYQMQARKQAEKKRNIELANWSSDDAATDVARPPPIKKKISDLPVLAERLARAAANTPDAVEMPAVSAAPEKPPIVPVNVPVVVTAAAVSVPVDLPTAATAAAAASSAPIGRTRNSRKPLAPQQIKMPQTNIAVQPESPPPVLVELQPVHQMPEVPPTDTVTNQSPEMPPVPPEPAGDTAAESSAPLTDAIAEVGGNQPLTKKEKDAMRRAALKEKQLEKKRVAEANRLRKAAERETAREAKRIADEEQRLKDEAEARERAVDAPATATDVPEADAQPGPIADQPAATTPVADAAPVAVDTKKRKRRSLMGLDVDESVLASLKEETPVRQSRRIAQIKIKEEAERRDIEEATLRKLKADAERKKATGSSNGPHSPRPSSGDRHSDGGRPSAGGSDSDASAVSSERKAAKKKARKRGTNPWQTDSEHDASDGAGADEEDALYEQHYESDHLKMGALQSDHEFSPESDLESEVAVPVKRARTARRATTTVVRPDNDDEYACQQCGKHDHPEWILLCDQCDRGYHCSCLMPILFLIPEGDWFCPPCQQQKLIGGLEQQLLEYELALQSREQAAEAQRRDAAAEAEAAALAKAEAAIDDEEYEEEQRKHRGDTDDETPEKMRSTADRRRKAPTNRNQRNRRRRSEAETFSESESDGANSAEKQQQRKKQRTAKSPASGSAASGTESKSSGDEPIYKLRKRRQTAVSYRFNEYDHLIDKAIKKEMDAADERETFDDVQLPIDGAAVAVATAVVAGPEDIKRPPIAEKQPRSGKRIDSDDSESEREKAAADDYDDDDEQPQARRTGKHMPGEEDDSDVEKVVKKRKPNRVSDDDNDDGHGDDAGGASDSGSDIRPKVVKRAATTSSTANHIKKKKVRKLNSLDIESEDDGSDDDFRTSSLSEDEEEDEQITNSDSDSSLDAYRKKKGGRGKDTRRSSRASRKRIDRDFINDSDNDSDDDMPLVTRKKAPAVRKKKDESDFSDEFNDNDSSDDDEEAEELDSDDLCDDSESDSGDRPWGSKQKRAPPKKATATAAAAVPRKSSAAGGGNETGGKAPANRKKAKPKEEDGDFKTSLPKVKQPKSGKSIGQTDDEDDSEAEKKKRNADDDDDDEDDDDEDDDDDRNAHSSASSSSGKAKGAKAKNRRTRGKKLTYLLDDFESSDDGIKPGVKRPDTPPEERAAFIKKQEEIKRMLAEKNTEAAKALAAPKISAIPTPEKLPRRPDSLSTIPLQIIHAAKALDVDLRRSGGVGTGSTGDAVKDSQISDADADAFDDALPDDFDPECMDEDEIAKMMEDEDFAQHQLKLGDPMRSKKAKDLEQQFRKRDGRAAAGQPLAAAETSEAPQQQQQQRHQQLHQHPVGVPPAVPHNQQLQQPQQPPPPPQQQHGPFGPADLVLVPPTEQRIPPSHGQPNRHLSAGPYGPNGPGAPLGMHGMPANAAQLSHHYRPQQAPAGPSDRRFAGVPGSGYHHGAGPPVAHGSHGHGPPLQSPPPPQSYADPHMRAANNAPNAPHAMHQPMIAGGGGGGYPAGHPAYGNSGMHPRGNHPPQMHQMMYGGSSVAGAPGASHLPPGAQHQQQMAYGMPRGYGGPAARQMMSDPRHHPMDYGHQQQQQQQQQLHHMQHQQQQQHQQQSGHHGLPQPHVVDAKTKLTKMGAEPKKRGRKSKAELQALQAAATAAAAMPPTGQHLLHQLQQPQQQYQQHQQQHQQQQQQQHPSILQSRGAPPPPHMQQLHHQLIGGGSGSSVASLIGPSASLIPTSVLAVQDTKLIDPAELGPPGAAAAATTAAAAAAAATAAAANASANPSGADDANAKKRGRRKKFTPMRDELQKGGVDLSTDRPPTALAAREAMDLKTNPILTERLTADNPRSGSGSTLSVATPPQLYSPSSASQPSVITRLPRPQHGSPFSSPTAHSPHQHHQQQQHSSPHSQYYPPSSPHGSPATGARHPSFAGIAAAAAHGAPPPLTSAAGPAGPSPTGARHYPPASASGAGDSRHPGPGHHVGMYRSPYPGSTVVAAAGGYPPGPPPPMHRVSAGPPAEHIATTASHGFPPYGSPYANYYAGPSPSSASPANSTPGSPSTHHQQQHHHHQQQQQHHLHLQQQQQHGHPTSTPPPSIRSSSIPPGGGGVPTSVVVVSGGGGPSTAATATPASTTPTTSTANSASSGNTFEQYDKQITPLDHQHQHHRGDGVGAGNSSGAIKRLADIRELDSSSSVGAADESPPTAAGSTASATSATAIAAAAAAAAASSSASAALAGGGGSTGAPGEFSGLVSYFSSQHDDLE